MKKICQSVLSITLSLMLLITGIIPVMAENSSLDIVADEKIFAGTKITVIARISNLTQEEALAGTGCDWEITGDDGTSIVSSKNDFKVELDDNGTYSATESAVVSLSDSSAGLNVTISAYYAGVTHGSINRYLYSPIKSISVRQTDSTNHAYYDSDTSTFYVDQYDPNNETQKNNNYGVLTVDCTPLENDDEISHSIVMPGGTTDTMSCDVTSNNYRIALNTKAKNASITFSSKSGYGNGKTVNIVKCIPLTSFQYVCNNTTYGSESDTITAIQGDPINIGITKANPTGYNDRIKYTLYDANNVAVDSSKYRIEYGSNNSCTLSINSIGSYTLVGEAVSYNNSNLERTLSRKIGIIINESKPVTDISFKEDEYTIYTVRENTKNLAGELNLTPSTDETNDVITYASDNTAVATVDTNGMVTAKSSGSANITATAKRGQKSATCKVTVIEAIKTITVATENKISQLPIGHKSKVISTISPATAQENISWSSSNPNIVSIDQNGNIEAISYNANDVSSNTITITATSPSGAEGSTTITVVPDIRAKIVTLTPSKVGNAALMPVNGLADTYSIYKGDTISILCEKTDSFGNASNDAIIWTARVGANPEVDIQDAKDYFDCTFSGDNIQIKSKTNNDIVISAYAVKAGQSYFDAVASKSITIKSNDKTTGITFSPNATSKTLPANSTYTFTVSLAPNSDFNKDNIVVVSDNETVATVNAVYNSNKNATVTVNTKENGKAVITCYVCYDVNNYATTSVVKKTLTVTVTNNINAAVVYGINDVTYKGSAYKVESFPAFQVYYGNTLLTNGTDYSVTYANNTNAGTATVKISGKNATYQGDKYIYFNIAPKQISDSSIQITAAGATFNGAGLTPAVTVKDTARNVTLKKGVDYVLTYSNNYNAGTGYVTVTGIGNYTGSSLATFIIKPLTVTSSTKGITISAINSMTATGKALKPIPTVTYNGVVLTYGVDYTMSYANNVNPGKATATVNFMGNLSGTRSISFTITAPTAPAGAKKVNGEFVNSKQKKAAISKLTKGKNSFKATWKKVTKITGYQIQYSTSSKFTKKTTKSVTVKSYKTTSSTVKKLKSKKKYYVRIRTYKNVKFNGKTVKVYSSWSKAKTIKTK